MSEDQYWLCILEEEDSSLTRLMLVWAADRPEALEKIQPYIQRQRWQLTTIQITPISDLHHDGAYYLGSY